jgi:hypothetical protein
MGRRIGQRFHDVGARVVEAERGLAQGHTREGQKREETSTRRDCNADALRRAGLYIHARNLQADIEVLY